MSTDDAASSFIRAIQRSGLLEYEQYTDLANWAAQSNADVQGVAKEVFRRRWLTQYQIKEIFKGRGQSLVLGPYVLLELLGEGGMGRVYKAHHARLGRDVALKIIRKEKLANPIAKDRFHAEIQAVAQMSHPNVVVAFDADQVGDTHFYVMEYIDGTDLAQIVKARGPLPMPEACEYVRQAALGLQHAAEMGLVHRDIKPSNLLVTRNGRQTKILDFGLARLSETPITPDMNRITQEGYVLGTPDFVAPEQARNPAGVDVRADIYALGSTLYFLLTGDPPFEGKTPADKIVKHCSEPPPDVRMKRPEAPHHLAMLIQWFMAKLPEHRPQTPAEVAAALLPYSASAAPGGSGPHIPYSAPAPAPPPQAHAQTAPQYVANPQQPQPVHYPHPVQPYGPQAYPAPPQRHHPMPAAAVDPAPSSQIFRLPTTAEDDPIRQRAEPPRSYVTLIAFLFGGLIAIGIIGFAVMRAFRTEPPPPLQKEFSNELGMKFVLLEGGTFHMGSAESEPGRQSDEGPDHDVTLNKFYISATEVTQAQYAELMGTNPAASGKIGRGFDVPVENVSWEDAVAFCQKLTKTHNPRGEGWAFRLPTEAEWEYACRAGTRTPFAMGDKLQYPNQAQYTRGSEETDVLAVIDENPDLKMPILPDKAASRKGRANAWGLWDMHGNVAEWCSDFYSRQYDAGPATNPQGPPDGGRRVIRGGSWKDPAIACRSAMRRAENPINRFNDVGFRVVYAPVSR